MRKFFLANNVFSIVQNVFIVREPITQRRRRCILIISSPEPDFGADQSYCCLREDEIERNLLHVLLIQPIVNHLLVGIATEMPAEAESMFSDHKLSTLWQWHSKRMWRESTSCICHMSLGEPSHVKKHRSLLRARSSNPTVSIVILTMLRFLVSHCVSTTDESISLLDRFKCLTSWLCTYHSRAFQ